jgi:hypothetical protein
MGNAEVNGINERMFMKNNAFLLVPLAMALGLMTGCKQENAPGQNNGGTNPPSSLSITQGVDDIKDATSNVWQKTKVSTTNAWGSIKDSFQSTVDYTYDQKNDFVANAQAKLDTMDQKIKELSDKAATAADSAKANVQAQLQTVGEKRTELGAKFDKMKAATADSWNDAKTDFKNSYEDVKNMVNEAWQSLTS